MSKAVPLALFLTAIILSIVYFLNSDINPNIISYDHSVANVVQSNGGVRGEFTASNNYLGLLTVRFDNKDIIEKNQYSESKKKIVPAGITLQILILSNTTSSLFTLLDCLLSWTQKIRRINLKLLSQTIFPETLLCI